MFESWGCGLYTSAAYTQVFTVFAVAQCRYLPFIKGYSQRYKICTLLKMEPRRENKLSGSNDICALRLITVEHDPVDFIFTWPFLL